MIAHTEELVAAKATLDSAREAFKARLALDELEDALMMGNAYEGCKRKRQAS